MAARKTPRKPKEPNSLSVQRDAFEAQAADEKAADAPERAPCLCGCGGTPKGKKARFLPGHDAKYHAAQKKAGAAS